MTQKQTTSLDEFKSLLDRFGLANDLDWLAAVLFARNIIPKLEIFAPHQKAEAQRIILSELDKNDLSENAFQHILDQLEALILQNVAALELQEELNREKRATVALVDEMNTLFSAMRGSRKKQEQSLSKFGTGTVQAVKTAPTRKDIITHVRGLFTEVVSEFREEAKQWEARAKAMERTASFDPLLSELHNRRSFESFLSESVITHQSRKLPLSLLMIDVDHFKNVNDSYGHQVGDDVLRALAKLVNRHVVQVGAFAARYGGEEITILLENTNLKKATNFAEALRCDVEGYEFLHRTDGKISGEPIYFTISIGVAELLPGCSTSSFVEAADMALYRAKNSGRNLVTTFKPGEKNSRASWS